MSSGQVPFGPLSIEIQNPVTGEVLSFNGTTWENTPASDLGLVNAVSNSDGTLTISPTTGSVVASLNLAHANTWSAEQTFGAGITGTGNTGALTPGSGILGTASSWSALQTFSAGVVTGGGGTAPTAITVGASPFTYTNSTGKNIQVLLGGGTVTAIAFNGTTIASGLTLSTILSFDLKESDSITVTYTTAPAMFYVPA